MLNQFVVHALNRILLLLSISCVTLVQRKPLSTERLVAVLQAELSWFLIQASIGWSHSRSCSRDHPGSEQPSHTWEKNWKITCKLLLLTNHKRYLLLKKSVFWSCGGPRAGVRLPINEPKPRRQKTLSERANENWEPPSLSLGQDPSLKRIVTTSVPSLQSTL